MPKPKKDFPKNPRQRWESWLEHLEKELVWLFLKRKIFWDLQKIAEENQKILAPGIFFNWMCDNYIHSMMVGVRKFTDGDGRSRSLMVMLNEISAHPGIFSRESNLYLYPNSPKHLANSSFDSLVGPNKSFLSEDQIKEDINLIKRSEKRVRLYTNKIIAHFARPGSIKKNPTFGELDDALTKVDEIFSKYRCLLTATGGNVRDSIPTSDAWQKVFYEPWIPSDCKLHRS